MKSNSQFIIDKINQIDDAEELINIDEAVEKKLVGNVLDDERHDVVHITQLAEEIDEYHKQWGKHVGVSTGYTSLDAFTKGLAPGEVILVAGTTSAGKSALAANIAVSVAKNVGVLYITLEMLKPEIGSRIKHINKGDLALDLMFQTAHSLDWRDYEPIVKNAIEKGGIKLVVLDYMQYLSRQMTLEEVAKMSKEIKRISLEYKVPTIVITQLRKTDKNDRRKWCDMEIEDIMGTASIGYDCDQAMIVSRKNLDNEFETDKVHIKFLKNRNRGYDAENPFVTLAWDKTRISEIKEWVPEDIMARQASLTKNMV